MQVAKQQQQALELEVNRLQHEAGLHALRGWLYLRQSDLNRKWPEAVGDERGLLQGEARGLARILKVLDSWPTIKEVPQV